MKLHNGWTLSAHELFQRQLDRLSLSVEQARMDFPRAWRTRAAPRCLAALQTMLLYRIPRNPVAGAYQMNHPLPGAHQWFRAEFAAARFALYYKVDLERRTILYVWLDDRSKKRAATGPRTPSVVFDDSSTVTEAGRAMVPHQVRQALHLETGTRLVWRLDAQALQVDLSSCKQPPRTAFASPAPATPIAPLVPPERPGNARQRERSAGAPLA